MQSIPAFLGVVTLLWLHPATSVPISRETRGPSEVLNSDNADIFDLLLDRDSDEDFMDYQADIYDNRIDRKISSRFPRPSPSDELPVKFLPPTSKGEPPKDLDFRFVRKILGAGNFDPVYMSEMKPIESILKPNGSINPDYKAVLPKEELPEEIQHLTFHHPGKDEPVKIKSKKHRRKLRQKLWAHISCPVVYQWRDLGPLFWPRWVKEGDCYKKHSCSVPAGMSCQRQDSTTKTFLYWHCRNKTHCKWIPIQFPIITKCKCGCPAKKE